ncbi:CDP-alcohol phosphatidyltransferase family protein [Streptomyces sp. NPDC058545]|uniref:CDP-alcohol phosphatidyltransferase family protein n=1 Tax=Streptomyces sp. NPDC058545 TaxID=3346544 RepID=UPI00365DD536
MNGLYALKPWYADRLSGVRATLVRREVSPDTLTAAGVASAAGAAAALAWLPTGPAALPVAVLLAARLAFANLDGALARETGRTTRRGAVLDELGDRAADLLVPAGGGCGPRSGTSWHSREPRRCATSRGTASRSRCTAPRRAGSGPGRRSGSPRRPRRAVHGP